MPVDKDRGSGNLLRSEYVYYTHTQPYPSSKPLPPVRGEVDSVRGEESREQISWGWAGQVRAAGGPNPFEGDLGKIETFSKNICQCPKYWKTKYGFL